MPFGLIFYYYIFKSVQIIFEATVCFYFVYLLIFLFEDSLPMNTDIKNLRTVAHLQIISVSLPVSSVYVAVKMLPVVKKQ